MQLFRKESDILVDVLLTLKTQGIVALPIHDAVVVRDDNSDKAEAVMKKVFREPQVSPQRYHYREWNIGRS